MEKFSPSQPEKENKKRSGVAKKVMLGAALAGAAGSLSACKEGEESTISTGDMERPRAESVEQGVEAEVQTFIDNVSNMEVGIDDARGRKILVKVDGEFGVLTDKLYGADNLANRVKTAKDILPEMPDQIESDDLGLIALMTLLDKYDLTDEQVEALGDFSDQMSGEGDAENGAQSRREQGSEVRRIQTDW